MNFRFGKQKNFGSFEKKKWKSFFGKKHRESLEKRGYKLECARYHIHTIEVSLRGNQSKKKVSNFWNSSKCCGNLTIINI